MGSPEPDQAAVTQPGRKEGRKEGREEGRKEGRKEGREEGRKGEREEGRKGGRRKFREPRTRGEARAAAWGTGALLTLQGRPGLDQQGRCCSWWGHMKARPALQVHSDRPQAA